MPPTVKKYILIGIGFVFAVLLAAGFLQLLLYAIVNFFLSPILAIINFFTPEQQEATINANSELIEAISAYESIVTIGDNGQYIINDETSELIINAFESNAIDTEAMGLSSNEFGNMIQKYVEAEMKTLYPKTNAPGNEMEGSIIIKRQFANSGTLKELIYEPWSTFKNRTDENAVNYFSINPETFELCIAEKGNSTIYKDKNGNVIQGNSTGITIKGYEYQTLVQNYSVPFYFLINLHVISLDTKFMNDVVDKVLNEESPIVITFVETLAEKVTTINYDGYDNTTYELEQVQNGSPEPVQGEESSEMPVLPSNVYKNIDESNATEYSEEAYQYHQEIVSANTVQMYVTNADTLFKKTEKKIEGVSTTDNNYSERILIPLESNTQRSSTTNPNWVQIKTNTRFLKEAINIKNTGKSFTVVDVETQIREKVEDFANFIREQYPNVSDNLTSTPRMLFNSLQENEATQQCEKIMRFVIAMLDGNKYGVTLDDLEYLLLDSDSYQTVSSEDLLERYYRQFINFIPQTTTIEGERYYIITEDLEGNPIVGNGVDANEFSGIYSIEIGDTIPVEVVDAKEEEILLERRDAIKVLTSSLDLDLESHQINALTLRSFDFKDETDYGLGNFGELYKNTEYWNPGVDNKFDEETTIADYNVKLFTEFWAQPYDPNTISKRRSEWTLFQTGYYDKLGEREPKVSAERILEMCESVMKDLLSHNVHYSLTNLVWNDIERSNNFSRYGCCCATYVSVVLYRTGALTKEQLNPYNYNYCGSGGMNDMLYAAGWKKVSIQDAQPGDVGVWPAHTFIYAGGNEIWDQNSGCISSDGDAPKRGTLKCWNSYKSKPGLIMWRMP